MVNEAVKKVRSRKRILMISMVVNAAVAAARLDFELRYDGGPVCYHSDWSVLRSLCPYLFLLSTAFVLVSSTNLIKTGKNLSSEQGHRAQKFGAAGLVIAVVLFAAIQVGCYFIDNAKSESYKANKDILDGPRCCAEMIYCDNYTAQ